MNTPGGSLVDGGTMTIAIVHDPGNLDPQSNTDQTNNFIWPFAYDAPVMLGADGSLQPGVATKWTNASPTEYTLTIRKGITCSDGSAMNAQVVADNMNYVADLNNKSPFIDLAIPAGAKATADTSAGTVTVKLTTANAFFLQNLALLALVCEKGLKDRSSLASASDGSGPYVLSEAVPNDHYTYKLRQGYAWGANGATTAEKGMPATLVMKVVSDETTAANLLLNGQLNVASVTGPDKSRLADAKLFQADQNLVQGQLYFNQLAGMPTADPAVRKALVQAIDLPTLNKIASAGAGVAPDGLVPSPKTCQGDTVTGTMPASDPGAAASALDAAGWKAGSGGIREKDGQKLSLTYLYSDGNLPQSDAAAEYLQTQWKAIGVDVTLDKKPKDQRNTVIFGTKDAKTWDVVMVGLQVSNPAMAVPYVSGTVPTDGVNFGHINNSTYDSLVAKASAESGASGCPDWDAAEKALFTDLDVVPFSNIPTPTWGKNATFELNPNELIPTSLRLYSGS